MFRQPELIFIRRLRSTYLSLFIRWVKDMFCQQRISGVDSSQRGLPLSLLPEFLPPFQLNWSNKSKLHVQVNNILFLPKSSVVSIHLIRLKQTQFPSQPSLLCNHNSNLLLPLNQDEVKSTTSTAGGRRKMLSRLSSLEVSQEWRSAKAHG